MPVLPQRAVPRVLVVDDDEVIRRLITLNLELEGYDVHTAVDGIDGLQRARDLRPDVVTLDVMMPGLDGWQTTLRLRADPDLARTPVCLITALAQQADIARGAQVGADAYLTKPFDPADLVATIRRLTAASGLRPHG
jgi:CheY-like chemotaxis protein